MSSGKTERNNAIMEALVHNTGAEVARLFGISRQRVEQIVKSMGGYPEGHEKYTTPIHRKIDGMLGTNNDSEIARKLGVTDSVVRHRRVHKGVRPYYEIRPDTCERCETEPYARGMCRRCYSRWLRKRGSRD